MMVMTKSKMANRYSPEVRARAVRMVFEHQGSYETQAGAIAAIAPKIGCSPQTLREWVKQAEKDSGMRDGVTTEERGRIKALEREVRELRQANEILRKGEAFVRHWSEDNGRALILRRRNSTAH
jgi:transposase-like protein